MTNAYRKSQGLPPLPEKNTIPQSLPVYAVLPYVHSFTSSEDPAVRMEALRKVQKLGLPALKPFLDATNTVTKHREEVEEAACELGDVVSEVRIDPKMKDAALISMANSLKGHPLTSDDFARIVAGSFAKWPPKTALNILAKRDNDGSGFTLTIGNAMTMLFMGEWEVSPSVSVGDKQIIQSGGSRFGEKYEIDDYDLSGIHTALSSPPLTPVYILITIKKGPRGYNALRNLLGGK